MSYCNDDRGIREYNQLVTCCLELSGAKRESTISEISLFISEVGSD